jgi:cytochrome c biogenesis protein CcdA/thiol-disulfide isomerase/thioredoxin
VGLLLIFAFVAGAGTAVSPCVLPVLPALLSAGATGGRRRPLGIVLGLALTFTLTVAVLAKVVSGVGLGDSVLRDIAIGVLLVFGVALAVPSVAARIEAPLSRLARFGPKDAGDGFWSGVTVGAALGFVYTPCAGPILAAVISVGATTGTTLRTLLVALAYAAGSAIVLLALMLGGRRLIPRTLNVQRVLGAVLIATAVAMIAQLDVRAEKAIAEHAPNANLAAGLEDSNAVGNRLNSIRPRSKFAERTSRKVGPRSKLPVLGTAPDFTGTQRWFNSKPLSLDALRGRVVLIDFWTYTCINCIRTLPYLKAWDARYRDAGLTIVGVHSPEFSFEKDAGNVQRAIKSFGIRYPVVQDNDLATWSAWGNQYWPAEYLIDAQGKVRHVHFGEGEYDQSENAIRSLLAERDPQLGAKARPNDPFTISAAATPETYVGSARAQGWLPSKPQNGTHTYTPPLSLPTSRFALGGTWRVTPEDATAVRDATLTAHVHARHVYLVLGGNGTVKVNGRPIRVTHQRLYTLADYPADGDHVLRLSFTPGVSAFAFTFG